MADTVRIDVPAKVWWTLAEQAETRGLTVADYLVAISGAQISRTGSSRRRGETAERVRKLHALGRTDREIAIRTGVTVNAVIYHRRRLGLAPNRMAAA